MVSNSFYYSPIQRVAYLGRITAIKFLKGINLTITLYPNRKYYR